MFRSVVEELQCRVLDAIREIHGDGLVDGSDVAKVGVADLVQQASLYQTSSASLPESLGAAKSIAEHGNRDLPDFHHWSFLALEGHFFVIGLGPLILDAL